MSIYKSAVRNPITTIMIFVAIIIFGLYSVLQLPVDFYPKMDAPFISVMTNYPGAGAAEIETKVTKRVEDALNTVQGLKDITSVSRDNTSIVSLEFEWNTNLDQAMTDTRDAVERILDVLPDGCMRPMIIKLNTSMMPIAVYAVTAKESYSGIEKILDEKVINPLNRVKGIASIMLSGAPKRYVYVEVDQNKLDASNLTIEQIGTVIQTANLNIPAGNVKMGKEMLQLRVEGEFKDSRELLDLVVSNYGGRKAYLRDVATVRDGEKDFLIDERINGSEGVRLLVMKKSDANTVQVAGDVEKELNKLSKTLPTDIKIQQIYDASNFIQNSISNLSETILFALIFVVMVILFFLGRWRATFIIALTIPVSLVTSFIYIKLTGGSINIISLSSLAIAIGMVVDDAIVVLENITRHIERGSSPREAAIYATNEVWLSVIISTLVVIAVFLPLTMIGGLQGVLFKDLGWIVTITISISLITAITLTPMLSAYLLRLNPPSSKKYNWDNMIGKRLDKLDDWYAGILRWCLQRKRWVIGLVSLVFIGSVFLGAKFVEFDFMPENDQSSFTLAAELEVGTRVEETAIVARKLEDIVRREVPEMKIMSSTSGVDDEASGLMSLFGNQGSNIVSIQVRLVDIKDRTRSDKQIKEALRPHIEKIPEIIKYYYRAGMGGMMGDNSIQVEIYGYDFDATNKLALELHEKFKPLKGARDVKISRQNDKAELKIVLDPEKLAAAGLNNATVSTFVRNRVYGMRTGYFREDGDEYDIVVRLSENSRSSITDIEELTIVNSQGKKIKLRELGQVQELWSPPNIEHKRRERITTISVTPEGVSLGKLAKKINEAIAETNIPQNVLVNVGGAYEDMQDANRDMGLLGLLIIALVFIVMASQFESFIKPFIIMASVLFAFTGVVLALLITGTTLSMTALLGAILLIGVVVKNGIVLVDYTNLMRDRGIELNEAIAMAGKSRLRPVIMTAITTILGLLPLALSIGEGSETWKPMGIVIIGGLTVSTVITMVVVPLLYAVVSRKGERDKEKKMREQFAAITE